MLIAAAIFLLTITLVIWQPRGLGVGWSAMLGAGLALLSGVVHLSDIPLVWEIIWNATATFVALIIISLLLDEAGFFAWAALHVARWGRGNGRRLFAWMIVLGALGVLAFEWNNPGTLGGIFYAQMTGGNYEIQIVPWAEPKTQLEFFNLRSGQTHDFEHILTGGGFNFMGELVPYWYRLTNVPRFFVDQHLATEVNLIQIFGSRILRYNISIGNSLISRSSKTVSIKR